MAMNPGKLVNRYNFTELFSRAWTRAMSPSNVVSGFRSTGVCPFDSYAIKVPGFEEEGEEEEWTTNLNDFKSRLHLALHHTSSVQPFYITS